MSEVAFPDMVRDFPKVVIVCDSKSLEERDGKPLLWWTMDAYKKHDFWEFVWVCLEDFQRFADYSGDLYLEHFQMLNMGRWSKNFLYLPVDMTGESTESAIAKIERLNSPFALTSVHSDIVEYEDRFKIPLCKLEDGKIVPWVRD